MMKPESFMWAIAAVMLIGGGLLCFRRGGGYPPVWVCAVLAVAALVGMWFLLNYQFGGMSIGVHV